MDMRQIRGSANCSLDNQPPTDCCRIFLYREALSNLYHIHCETRMMPHCWHSWDQHHGWMCACLGLLSHVENDSSVVAGYLNVLWICSDSKHECLIGKYYTYFKDEEAGYIEGKWFSITRLTGGWSQNQELIVCFQNLGGSINPSNFSQFWRCPCYLTIATTSRISPGSVLCNFLQTWVEKSELCHQLGCQQVKYQKLMGSKQFCLTEYKNSLAVLRDNVFRKALTELNLSKAAVLVPQDSLPLSAGGHFCQQHSLCEVMKVPQSPSHSRLPLEHPALWSVHSPLVSRHPILVHLDTQVHEPQTISVIEQQ